MKITEYPSISEFTEDQVFLLDGDGGTKQASVMTAVLGILHLASVENHKSIVRGANLGTSLTSAQIAAIQDGTFDNIWLGDYWVINGYTWRIVDFDYWYNQGDTACTSHHAVIMPDSPLYASTAMNSSNTTSGGYVGSEMYTANLEDAKTLINNAFGSTYILSHREYLTSAVTSGYPSGGDWYDSTVELPNEIMMFGCPIYTPASDGSTIPRLYTASRTQLALMRVSPYYINPNRANYWLRDVVSATSFANVSVNGSPYTSTASAGRGVRPVFPLG